MRDDEHTRYADRMVGSKGWDGSAYGKGNAYTAFNGMDVNTDTDTEIA